MRLDERDEIVICRRARVAALGLEQFDQDRLFRGRW